MSMVMQGTPLRTIQCVSKFSLINTFKKTTNSCLKFCNIMSKKQSHDSHELLRSGGKNQSSGSCLSQNLSPLSCTSQRNKLCSKWLPRLPPHLLQGSVCCEIIVCPLQIEMFLLTIFFLYCSLKFGTLLRNLLMERSVRPLLFQNRASRLVL